MKEYFKHISLPTNPVIDPLFADTKDGTVLKVTQGLIASVVKFADKTIFQAIIDFAKEHGYSDIYLIDEEFVITALKNELERRMQNGSNTDK